MDVRNHRIIARIGTIMNRWHWVVAGGILTLMLGLAYSSMIGNSAIVDEVAHIPAAYSYLQFGDFRLNPEHPPLIKNLAGLPLQFLNLAFPTAIPAWTTEPNGQWETGWHFLYHIGNDADLILYWSRLPILLLAIAFGVWLYAWLRRRYGIAVALLSLWLYALSPNILAHSTFVTTDVGASIFMFTAIVAFAAAMQRPNLSRFLVLALALALAELAKFSAVMLYPFLGILSVVVAMTFAKPKKLMQRLQTYVGGFLGACLMSLAAIWLFYIPQTMNMTAELQDRIIRASINSGPFQFVADILVSINDITIFKSIAHYILGIMMVYGRVSGGNVTYFNGVVSDSGSYWFFPELFVTKTQIALLILIVVVIAVAIIQILRGKSGNYRLRFIAHFRKYLMEWILGLFSVTYACISIAGNLNLGIRHIMPIFVPIFVLVAIQTVKLWRRASWKFNFVVPSLLLGGLVVWYGASAVRAAPNFVSYFNGFIGGSTAANQYFSDSNVDWGQDLKRLREYLELHPEIKHVAVDYFGGASVKYYFCNRAYDDAGVLVQTSEGYDCSQSIVEEWRANYGRYTGEYIAVSETFLQNDLWYAALEKRDGYEYLRNREPIAKIGYSIYLYKLK